MALTTVLDKQITFTKRKPHGPHCSIECEYRNENGYLVNETKFVPYHSRWHGDIQIGQQYDMEYTDHYITKFTPIEEIMETLDDFPSLEMSPIEKVGHVMNAIVDIGIKFDDILPAEQACNLQGAYDLLRSTQEYFFEDQEESRWHYHED